MPPATRGKKVDYKILEDGSDDEFDEEQPRAKRSKSSKEDSSFIASRKKSKKSSTKAPSRARGGKLRNLMLMPVDIFLEICQCLHPKDLRALSLTAQGLRKVLMSRDSRHVWKSCLLEVPGLPECPSDLNEPQYVRLLFSSECYGCGTHCGFYEFYHRVLFCDKCFQTHMVDDKYRLSEGDNADMPEELRWLFASGDINNPCYNGKKRWTLWRKDLFDEALAEYRRILGLSPDLLEKFTSEAREDHGMRTTTATAINKWKESEGIAKRILQDKLKDEHRESVEARLLLLGWQRGDIPEYHTNYNSLVRKPKKLTDKAWQTLLPKLEPILEEGKRARLKQEAIDRRSKRESDLQQRYRNLVKDEFLLPAPYSSYGDLPLVTSLREVPKIKDLIDDDSHPVITQSLWSTVIDDVRTWALRHGWSQLNTLIGILDGVSVEKSSLRDAPGNLEEYFAAAVEMASRLSLVTSGFRCTSCKSNSLHWCPTVFEHCRRYHRNQTLETSIQRVPQELISAVLRNLNQVSELTTYEELLSHGRSVICTRCDERVAPYRTIEKLIHHYLRFQTWYSLVKRRTGSPEDQAEIRNTHDFTREEPIGRMDDQSKRHVVEQLQREFAASEQLPVDGVPASEFNRGRGCKLCPSGLSLSCTSWPRLKIHIETVHGKTPDVHAHTATEWLNGEMECPVL